MKNLEILKKESKNPALVKEVESLISQVNKLSTSFTSAEDSSILFFKISGCSCIISHLHVRFPRGNAHLQLSVESVNTSFT